MDTDHRFPETLRIYSTGLPALDDVLGVGGYARGRVIEVYGPASTRAARVLVALHAAAAVQRAKGIAALVDLTHTLNPEQARHVGVDLETLLIAQPDDGEQALGIVEALARSGAVDLIVVDSVAAMFESGAPDADLHARTMSRALRKIVEAAARTGAVVLFLNETETRLGVTFGNQEVASGGNALKFYASVRIDVRGGEDTTTFRVVKNKLAPPFRSVEIDLRQSLRQSA